MTEYETQIEYIKRDIDILRQQVNDRCVTRIEFGPVQKIVYGLVTIALTSVMLGLIALILKV